MIVSPSATQSRTRAGSAAIWPSRPGEKCPADAALERHDDAVEVRLGEDHDADADDDEHGEPAERELERPHRRVWGSDLFSPPPTDESAERTRFAGHRAALIDHAAANGESVTGDLSARMQPEVAVDDDRRAGDRAEDVERAVDDTDGGR